MQLHNKGRPVKIGLMQINNSFSGQNYFPLSVGMLQAYAQHNLKNPEQFEFMTPLYTRMRVEEAVERLHGADILPVSNYVWSDKISHAIAKEKKRRNPETLVVFGGPQVPDRLGRKRPKTGIKHHLPIVGSHEDEYEEWFDSSRVEAYLREHPYIDIACHGEGEPIALALLENFKTDWMKIPSISFLNPRNGQFTQTERALRTGNLDQFPSPYLEGTFDKLMRENPDQDWIVMGETNRGGPFSGTFFLDCLNFFFSYDKVLFPVPLNVVPRPLAEDHNVPWFYGHGSPGTVREISPRARRYYLGYRWFFLGRFRDVEPGRGHIRSWHPFDQNSIVKWTKHHFFTAIQ